MKRIQALINKETLKYIVDGKKVSKEYILKFCKCKSTQLDRWLEIHNDAYPTIKQAKNLAKCLHIPFAALYMNSKDIKLKSIPYIKNFRTVQDADNVDDSLLNLTIIDLLIERNFLIEAKKELGWESEPFCADIPKSNSSKVWADEIRHYFSLDLETQYNFSNTRQFYLYLRGKIEKKGIFIQCFKGLEVETIRGIAIYDDKMPVIGINDKDRHPGKLFSIIHEIVHIYKQQSSFCNDMNNSNDDIQEEVFCNAVAGEVLVPERAIKNIMNDKKITNISDMKNIELLSKKFSVSREVIIRRLYDTKLIGWEQYEKFNDVIKKEYENTSEKEHSTRKNTVSKPAARNMSKTIIDRTSSEICKVLYEGYCEQIYDEIFISEYLGLNVEHVDYFLKEVAKWDS